MFAQGLSCCISALLWPARCPGILFTSRPLGSTGAGPSKTCRKIRTGTVMPLFFFFLLLEEEREVRGHVGHPRSCIRMAAGASLTWLPASPCSPPDLPPPIGSCNENHAVRFQVLWKTVNAGIVFTLSAATTSPRRGLNVSCLILLPRSDG